MSDAILLINHINTEAIDFSQLDWNSKRYCNLLVKSLYGVMDHYGVDGGWTAVLHLQETSCSRQKVTHNPIIRQQKRKHSQFLFFVVLHVEYADKSMEGSIVLPLYWSSEICVLKKTSVCNKRQSRSLEGCDHKWTPQTRENKECANSTINRL